LVNYASAVAGRAERIILIHGETDAAEALQEKLRGVEGMPPVHFPERLTTFEL
jgi:predicted metal-dependent RNase